jgi:hypothetical protein
MIFRTNGNAFPEANLRFFFKLSLTGCFLSNTFSVEERGVQRRQFTAPKGAKGQGQAAVPTRPHEIALLRVGWCQTLATYSRTRGRWATRLYAWQSNDEC